MKARDIIKIKETVVLLTRIHTLTISLLSAADMKRAPGRPKYSTLWRRMKARDIIKIKETVVLLTRIHTLTISLLSAADMKRAPGRPKSPTNHQIVGVLPKVFDMHRLKVLDGRQINSPMLI